MKTDIFISYPRTKYGSLVARAIYERLINNGYQVFLDCEAIERGQWEPQIKDGIREADDILLILPEDCFAQWESHSFFLKEIEWVRSLKKQIIPVMMEGFRKDSTAPDEIKSVSEEQGVNFNCDCDKFDGLIGQITRLLISSPVKGSNQKGTQEYYLEISAPEIRLVDTLGGIPDAFAEKLESIRPLYEGIPFFTNKGSIETRLASNLEFYLAPPDDLIGKMSYSKSSFSGTDVNLDFYLDRMNLRPKERAAIEKALLHVKRKTAKDFISRSNGNFFNGKKYGVFSSDANGRTADAAEKPVLHLDLFCTDYFTHQVMYSLYSRLRGSLFYDMLMDKKLDRLSMFRTSLGISIIVEIPAENSIILTKRSTLAAYSAGKEWIYPSVTESVSETDYNKLSELVDMDLCVKRGLMEELGINTQYYDDDLIKYYSMFYETHFSQDNLTASVKLKDWVTSRQILNLRAKDRDLEISDLIILPLDPGTLKSFILNNLDTFRPQALFTVLEYLKREKIDIDFATT